MAKTRSNPKFDEGVADPLEPGLDAVIVTELLRERASRPPNFAAECRALLALAEALAQAPLTVLQKLADAAVELTGAGSAGISVLETVSGKSVFRWRATAGAFFPFAQSALPRDFSPCGVVLDRNTPQLMSQPVRFFPYIADLQPPVSEVLLVPFHRGTEPIGTVWIVAHTEGKHFDAEDQRIVTSLSKFASAAVAAVANTEAVAATERTLENDRLRLASVIENAPALICALRGPDHVFELANQRYRELIGNREIIGKSVRAALPEVEGQGFFELLDDVYRTGDTFTGKEMPVRLRRKDSDALDERFMNFVYQPLREVDGSVSGIFVHGIDVTEMVLARKAVQASEQRLRTSEERLAFSVEAAELGTFFCPMPLGRIEWNAKCKEHFWLPPDAEVDFDLFYSLLHPDDRERTHEAVQQAVFERRGYDIEYRTVSADGRVRWVGVRTRFLRRRWKPDAL